MHQTSRVKVGRLVHGEVDSVGSISICVTAMLFVFVLNVQISQNLLILYPVLFLATFLFFIVPLFVLCSTTGSFDRCAVEEQHDFNASPCYLHHLGSW